MPVGIRTSGELKMIANEIVTKTLQLLGDDLGIVVIVYNRGNPFGKAVLEAHVENRVELVRLLRENADKCEREHS